MGVRGPAEAEYRGGQKRPKPIRLTVAEIKFQTAKVCELINIKLNYLDRHHS